MNKELLKVLLKVQKEMPVVTRTTEAFNYKYAPLEEVWEKVKKVIQDNGFYVGHEIGETGVITTAHHEHGVLTSFIPFSKAELAPQNRGSEITYYKRYNVQAIFNIQVQGEDDDAVKANDDAKDLVTDAQVNRIRWLMNQKGLTETKAQELSKSLFGASYISITKSQASEYMAKLEMLKTKE